ncbi:YbaB/EbfC family nucleoid-associated protein [Nocardia xishanensis]|uniref:YbaB/EbfC family nucleoid-associated protein n=1 Tax=Nocardia xishanensis TaxID=238964 RepID=UPI000ADFCEF1|nr:YbaB/EbfC family nucleoid-associated protein [Nocardia xishanensis]
MTTSGRMEGEIAGLMEDFRSRMRNIAQVQQERIKLTATASTRDRAVSVTVNANGVVIETKFTDRVEEMSYDQIAKVVTRLAQQAAEEVFAKSKTLTAPLLDERFRLPKLSDVIEGMPNLETEIPVEPPVSMAPPGSPERSDDAETMTFTDVESYHHDGRGNSRESVTGQAW